jgi:hypothetical protein
LTQAAVFVSSARSRGGTIISTESIAPGARQHHAGAVAPGSMTPTPEEREALAKIADGNCAISQEHMRRLFMMRLVERPLGRVQLTREGRQVLGLSAA